MCSGMLVNRVERETKMQKKKKKKKKQTCDAKFPAPGPPKVFGAGINQPSAHATDKQVMNNDMPETFF